MTKKEAQKYTTLDSSCVNLECFTPFSGNGRKICRLYELGKCPPAKERKKREKK
ncbi:MAG: hypothetical protein LBV80_08145 [Deltaproteobacteria bacterium]|nr:hypothetical protein [Deltaproteobacteria bacterium]